MVLELVEGPTLADRIKQGPIPLDEALPIAKQIAEALEAAHEQGVIHRDLKPANIKAKADGTVKVLDFGLAKAFQPDASDPSMSMSPTISLTAAATQMGMVIGTAAYMAPEQAKGKPVDKRADVWAFGAVLYETLTGRKMFEAGDVSEMLASVLLRDPDISGIGDRVPAHIQSLLRRCLVKNPQDRLRDIGEIRIALNASEDVGVASAHATTTTQLRVWQRPITLALTVVVVALVTGLGVWTLTRPASPRLARLTISTSPPPWVNPAATPDVVISPDGTRMVYVADVADGTPGGQLYVRALDQLDAVLLRGAEAALNPFISPDGNSVGYWSFQDQLLKKVSIHGGPPITVVAAPAGIWGASWGPDDTIIFAAGLNTGLLRVSAAGGESEQLTTLEEGEIAHRWPHVLPGGQSVLFTVVKGQGSANMEIAALNLDSGERTLLVPGGSNPHYASTGHLIYGVDGTLRVVAGADFGIIESELGWVDRDGQMTPLMQGNGQYQHPHLSPDGQQVAVGIAGDSIDIWLYDIERDSPARLTEQGENYYPVWLPDGTGVTFASDRSGTYDLYRKAADGSGDAETLLAKPTLLFPGSWSPDGTTLAFYEVTDGDSGRDIWTLRPDGEASAVIATAFNERAPRLSPDGQWLVYVSDQSGEDGATCSRFQTGVGSFASPRELAPNRSGHATAESSTFAMAIG